MRNQWTRLRSIAVMLCMFCLLDAQTILFIRGGSGTGGFLEGGADEQLSDIHDKSTAQKNHGWFTLAETLRKEGYVTEQVIERPASNNTPIPLDSMDLSAYDVIVFGSNNADYSERHADTLESYIRGGGAALFISDANWGRNWGDAPGSDQTFLNRFGLIMNQDRGTYVLQRWNGDFIIGNTDRGGHPLLQNVDAFDGEGVSPITLGPSKPGVEALVLAKVKKNLRVNSGYSQGSTRSPTIRDGSLVAAIADKGRIVCHFDRNTFFNRNGAGTDIHRHDNMQYAKNLFAWLTFRETTRVPIGPITSRAVQFDFSVYPNPGYRKTTVQFHPAGEHEVQIRVYDALGRSMMTLFQGRTLAGQTHMLSFDPSSWPTGVYLIRAGSFDGSRVKRFMHFK